MAIVDQIRSDYVPWFVVGCRDVVQYPTQVKQFGFALLWRYSAMDVWTSGASWRARHKRASRSGAKGGMQNFGCSIYSQGVGRGARRQVEVEVRSAPVPVMKRSVRFGYYDLLIDNNN